MKRIALAVMLTLGLAACGSSSDNGGGGGTPFPRPTGYVAVSFSVNDTANKVYANEDLAWKGAMKYTAATRIIEKDDTWGGPFAPLYDDGPWTSGGHEPEGATAGDHILGTTVFIKPPATQAEVDAGKGSVGYGLIDVKYDKPVAEGGFGNGWIWVGDNGNFTIPLNSTLDVTATGMTLPAFGTIDFKLTLDTNNLVAKDPAWDTSKVEVKGSAWAWGAVTIATGTAGVYTFTLSENVGLGKPFNHTGLLKSGQKPEFVWVLGGAEYKDGGICSAVGAKAYTKPSGGAFTEQTITIAANNNTIITVP